MFQTLLRSGTLSQGAHYIIGLRWSRDMWSCVVTSCHIFDCAVRDVATLWYLVTCSFVFCSIHKETEFLTNILQVMIHQTGKSHDCYLVTVGGRTCPSGAQRPSLADAYHWHPGILRQLVTDPKVVFLVRDCRVCSHLPPWFICLNPLQDVASEKVEWVLIVSLTAARQRCGQVFQLTPPRTRSLFPLRPTKWEIYHRPFSNNHQTQNVTRGTHIEETLAYHCQSKQWDSQQYAGRAGTGPDSWVFLFAHNTGRRPSCLRAVLASPLLRSKGAAQLGKVIVPPTLTNLRQGRLPLQLHRQNRQSHRDKD